jgi:hypothetical protein
MYDGPGWGRGCRASQGGSCPCLFGTAVFRFDSFEPAEAALFFHGVGVVAGVMAVGVTFTACGNAAS